ncbi:MAG: insulinase family protein [candidate division KSB1 bacterium]|nr:insulinase family protein [candidate division KSB1 bacterium]MDZ7300716.1 insulinase family protein [candidate division KSB1 bacterium]MDZ7310014.1 insulinase family protein [candidate division KSB1 bacterium]
MTVIHGFELIRQEEIPEYKTKASLYRHLQTGAELLSMENDDENKVFGITFRTPPKDSTGVAHIMEHSVLCGSRKYPVKEPFVELIKGSLNTFLNAMTYPDKTCYPVASTNLQDFYNLIDVYLDAVFYPRLTPYTLQQEGWHYELENPADPIVFKGVVFNEMKGAYSSPDRLLGEYSQQSLFPDTTYGVDAGGHPRHIPDLTFEQFMAFHKSYYHPSNAFIYFYGDDQPEERLRILNAYLKDFTRAEIASEIPLQPRIDQPKRLVRKYDAGQETEMTRKAMVTVNWLLTETTNPETTLAVKILAHILIGTPASPLYKALIDSGLGEDLAGVGLESELRQMYFSTGLKGIAVADADKVESLIFETLRQLSESGIDPQTVEASLNTIEFRLRENNTGSFPRGLSLMLRALTTWLYGGDPLAPLTFEAPLAAIKAHVAANERFFENMIRQHLLQNQHRVTVILEPDPQAGKQEEAAEKERLAKASMTMSKEELQKVIDDTRTLKLRQATPDPPEALATIPMLKLSDLDRQNKIIPLTVIEKNGNKILFHDLFTNGIIYLEVGFDLHTLPQELLPYLPLFSRALTEMGTDKEDFVQLSQRIGRKTGGLWPRVFTSAVYRAGVSAAWLFLRGKAMTHQSDELLAILRDVLLTARLDNRERFRQMVLDAKAGMEAGLVPGGSQVVSTRLGARFNEADWAEEQMGGVSQLFFLRQLAQEVDSDWPKVQARLELIRKLLINRQRMICNVTLDAANYAPFEPKLLEFIGSLPTAQIHPATWSPAYDDHFEGLTIPAQVNYVGKGANLYKLGYQFHGSALVIGNYLRTTWLWERVRVQGGAYGGFCNFDRRSGVFAFVSYRDPNLLATLDNYDQAGKFLREVELSDEELAKSIIGTIGDLDAYQLPDAKGFTSMVRYLVGDTDEERQKMRDEVLATTVTDFRKFGEVLQQVNQHGIVVVLGSPAAIEAANAERKDWLKVVKVL